MTRNALHGESFIETLVALLIGSVSLMLLATMISASAKLIRLSENDSRGYTQTLNEMNAPNASADPDGTAEFQFRADTNGDGAIDDSDVSLNPYAVNVKIKSYRDGTGKFVISYEEAEDT